MNIEISKTRKILGWVIAGLLTALYLFSASGKIIHPEQLNSMKLTDWRILIAIGEVVSSLIFLFPKTSVYGTFLLSAYMGGAIIIHMTVGISIFMPSIVLVLVWVGSFVRNPELLAKFSKNEN